MVSETRREIGLVTAVALVMGNMIGSGVFLLPASLARYGGLSLVGWLVSAVGSVLLALVFARLARFNPAAGGPYAYTRQAFGDLAGFLVAWGYWISTWCTNAALAVAFVGYLDPFVPNLVRNPTAAASLAIVTLWALTAANVVGVRTAGRIQAVTTMLKILPLVMIGLAGLVAFEPEHFAVSQPGTRSIVRDVMATATLTLWAFLGLESATIPAGSVSDPERTIPRATVIGTVIAASIYIVSTIGIMSLIEPTMLGQMTAPFAEAARVTFGERVAQLVAVGAAISCFGALNGWILLVGQLPLAIAQDGLFPRVFSRLSLHGTPAHGMVISGVLTTLLIAFNYSRHLVDLFTFIILLATLSTLVPYVFCSLASLQSDQRRRGGPQRPSVGPRIVASLAFVYAVGAVIGAGRDVIVWGVVLFLAGIPVYVRVVDREVDPASRTR